MHKSSGHPFHTSQCTSWAPWQGSSGEAQLEKVESPSILAWAALHTGWPTEGQGGRQKGLAQAALSAWTTASLCARARVKPRKEARKMPQLPLDMESGSMLIRERGVCKDTSHLTFIKWSGPKNFSLSRTSSRKKAPLSLGGSGPAGVEVRSDWKPGIVSSDSPVLNGDSKNWNALSRGTKQYKRKGEIFCHLGNALWNSGRSMQIVILFLCDGSFFILITYLWFTPLIILVGDQRGSWAVRITPRRNWFGFWTSGWAEVSVWLRVYSWSQAARRIWNYSISSKGRMSIDT